MRRLGFCGSVYSIRDFRRDEMEQDFADLGPTTYLPSRFEEMIASDAEFRRNSRKAQEDMRRLWGGEGEKRRIHESLWLREACRAGGTRHLHVHFAALAARTAFWLRRLGGPTYSVTAHANDIFCDEPSERLEQTLGCAECIITVSDFSASHLATHFPKLASKIHRVYNGIDLTRFRISDIPEGRPLLLAVGRSIEKKGFGDLIDACARLGDIDFECQIIGGGPMDEELRSHVQEAGLGEKVRVVGPKTEAEIIELLSRGRAFVLPCVRAADGGMDNLPTVIMEAMAASLPVVSTVLAGIPEMVEDGKTGYLVPERSPAMLAECLQKLLLDPGLARRLGANGLEKCRNQFSIEVTSRALWQVWSQHGVAVPAALEK